MILEIIAILGLLPPYKPPPPGAIIPITSDPSSSNVMPAGIQTNALPLQTDDQNSYEQSSPTETIQKIAEGKFYKHSWHDPKCQIQCNKAE